MQTELKTFLGKVCNPDLNSETIEIRNKSKNGNMESFFSNNLEEINKKVEELKPHNDIYFGIAPRKNNDSGKKDNCSSISSLWVDIDCGQDGHKKSSFFSSKEEALTHIKRVTIKPSLIVDSGNGLHLYFFLNQKLGLNEETIPLIEKINKTLGLLFGGDSVHNVDRIMRLPGTQNHKTETPKGCKILEYDSNITYEPSNLMEDSLLKINWDHLTKLKTSGVLLYNLLFGKDLDKLKKPSRSEADQTIISALISNGFTSDIIKLLFQSFPTTGKYFDHPSPEVYLESSIKSAGEFISENNSMISILDETLPSFTEVNNSEEIGYTDRQGQLLNNFLVRIKRIVKLKRDGEVISKLSGSLLFKDKEVPFENVPADILAEQKKFKSFIINHEPTSSEFYDGINSVIDAVRLSNSEVPVLEEVEFGFNEDLTEYRTDSLSITKAGINSTFFPIKYSEKLGDNKLLFLHIPEEELSRIKQAIISIFFTWDSAEVIFNSIAFALLPIIHPFLKNIEPTKPYLFLRGASGNGKSLISKFIQKFYGKFLFLVSSSSTGIAIGVIGVAFKDALYVVDDIKMENFRNENEMKNFMAVLQNYADGTSRQRANIDLKIRDAMPIKGILALNGEDIVFPEASTIARGIYITINAKPYMPEKAAELNELSNEICGLTPHYIKYILSTKSEKEIINLFKENRNWFERKVKNDPTISFDNLSRIINNFAMLKTSWDLLINFLCENPEHLSKYNSQYENSITEVLFQTIDRVNTSKNDIKFEKTLWELMEQGHLHFEQLDPKNTQKYYNENKGTKVGWYAIINNKIKIGIHLKNALREIKRHEPLISITEESLKMKLFNDAKIAKPEREKVSFGKQKRECVEWIGEFPRHLFGLAEKPDALSKAEEILSESYNMENNSSLFRDEFLSDIPADKFVSENTSSQNFEDIQF